MRTILGLMAALVSYICVATVLALSIGMGYLWQSGRLQGETVFKIMAAVHGVDLQQIEADQQSQAQDQASMNISYEDIERKRALESLHLQVKMEALEKATSHVRFEREQLMSDKQNQKRVSTRFEEQLAELSGESVNQGIANVRGILEAVKPDLAKDELMTMRDKGELEAVVVILAGMSPTSRADIIGKFTTDEEKEVLDEILRMMRQGYPNKPLIEQAVKQLGIESQ